ncbi:MAG: lycopene cyclase family protein [Merismopedia sp. SIO2A8]|nr:lycopene cyclase family protein [Symploca sp. SIO2B6]NET48691.1 lycopene cyclase family protein [Merismopedia sp. SIO2A8]
MLDVLVVGAGPAGLAIAAQLCQRGLTVGGVAPTPPDSEWRNTYGIWVDELSTLNLPDLLAHQWHDCVGYFSADVKPLNRAYGLFDKYKLQTHFLTACNQGAMVWHQGTVAQAEHHDTHSTLWLEGGKTLEAHIIVDASGHTPALVTRSQSLVKRQAIAYQAAYGVVGHFSSPPVKSGQFVLMDYRADHLSEVERQGPPTFLYAMDLGNDIFFVEETSLAESPAVSFETLKHRLQKRLAFQGIQIQSIQEEEYCLFPMNAPMPHFRQSVVGFGGAASMVHPATGYMVGALLRRAPTLADAIATALDQSSPSPENVARAAWSALWSSDRLRKYYIYQFGLETLMRFDHPQLCRFFNTFFDLPQTQWSGFLADTLSSPELVLAMINLFGKSPNTIRLGLTQSLGYDGQLLWRSLTA